MKSAIASRAALAAALVLSLGVFRDYWARQFLLVARKPGGGGPAAVDSP